MTRVGFMRRPAGGFHFVGALAVHLFLAGCGTFGHAPPLNLNPASARIPPPSPMHAIPTPSQFRLDEALAMIEFCVDLDSEDDRAAPDARRIYQLRADRSLRLWDCLVDSRGLVGAHPNDPTRNGFDPFDSAWTLWKRHAPEPDGTAVYALAFRGTVFGNKQSVIEDALATMVGAHHGLELPAGRFLPLTFATLPRSQVHAGFAYSILGALFDRRYGALKAVQDHVARGSTLVITGHSQGAALGTLAHAFFHYAAQGRQFGVEKMDLRLRSYVFAQPKPGNYQFGFDFAQISGGGATSFVFNNTLDPVPMLPPAHMFAIDAMDGLPGRSLGSRFARFAFDVGSGIGSFLAGLVRRDLAKHIRELQVRDHEGLLHSAELRAGSTPTGTPGGALSYVAVGNVIPLTGLARGSEYFGVPKDENDAFIQHHAPVYRQLMERLYGLPLTVENSPELEPPPPHRRTP